jgi:hypothetical protein
MAWPDEQPERLTRADAIALVRELAADSDRIILTDHCRIDSMPKRGIPIRAIIDCLRKGVITEGPALDIYGNWKMNIYRQTGDLTCAVAIKWRTHLLVITVF